MAQDVPKDYLDKIDEMNELALKALCTGFKYYRNSSDYDVREHMFRLRRNLETSCELLKDLSEVLKVASPSFNENALALLPSDFEQMEMTLNEILPALEPRGSTQNPQPQFDPQEFKALLKKIKKTNRDLEVKMRQLQGRSGIPFGGLLTGQEEDKLDDDVKKALNWLCPPLLRDPQRVQKEYEKQIVPDTATWILERDEYKKWQNKAGQFLWINSLRKLDLGGNANFFSTRGRENDAFVKVPLHFS